MFAASPEDRSPGTPHEDSVQADHATHFLALRGDDGAERRREPAVVSRREDARLGCCNLIVIPDHTRTQDPVARPRHRGAAVAGVVVEKEGADASVEVDVCVGWWKSRPSLP